MVAIDCGSYGELGNFAAFCCLTGAVCSDGVTKDTGGPGDAVAFVDSRHIYGFRQILGGDAGDVPTVLAGSGAVQLQEAAGIVSGQHPGTVVVGSIPVEQGNAVIGGVLGSEEVVDTECTLIRLI